MKSAASNCGWVCMLQLGTAQLGQTLLSAAQLPSTQTLLQTNAQHFPDGTVCVADVQSGGKGGRQAACLCSHASWHHSWFGNSCLVCTHTLPVPAAGRGGNVWTSPRGCLMFSALMRLKIAGAPALVAVQQSAVTGPLNARQLSLKLMPCRHKAPLRTVRGISGVASGDPGRGRQVPACQLSVAGCLHLLLMHPHETG
jgi:hypothetical protein